MPDPSPRPAHDDAELATRAARGDLDAFASLVERHRDVAVRVAASIAGPDDAEDVAQDGFLRAFHRLDRYAASGSFRAWLLRIVHNAAIDHRRRRSPEPVDPSGLDEREPAPAVREPAERLEVSERIDRLEAKLRLLPDAHRTVLVLRDVEGLSYGEISAIADVPLGTVKGRLHRARSEFIELLRRNTYDWELPR